MTIRSRCKAVTLFVALALTLTSSLPLAAGQAPSLPEAGPLTVMSFNIRLGTANDGENHWTRRRDMLFDLLRRENADLIGVQEAFRFQIDEILAAVPGYAVVGVARDDGRAAGEASAILFRSGRFHVSQTGTFWFSDTPDVPGTRTWGNRYNRISTWARFVDRDGSAFWHYNLHLDHEVQVSREKSTELLMQRIGTRPFAAEPVIITGDFNAGEDNVAVHRLIGAPGAAQTGLPPFVDTYRVIHPGEKIVGTFNSWIGTNDGPKIDYVLVQPGVRVLSASILRDNRDGRYPSDHYPVVARVQLPVTR